MNAINFPVGRDAVITPQNNGDLYILGNTSNEADAGGWMLTLMPDSGVPFVGSVTIMRRPEGRGAANNGVGFMPSPYRRMVVNNVASDTAWDSVALTGATEVQVPANGISVAFMVQCSSGSATLYSRPIQGTTAL